MKSRFHSVGFTLLELMVAIALLGILAVAAGPSLSEFVDTVRLRSAERDMVSALQYTRAEAVRRRQNVHIKPINGDWEQGWYVTTNAAATYADCGVAATCLQVYEVSDVGVRDYGNTGILTYSKEGRPVAYQLLIFCDRDWSNQRKLSYVYLYPSIGTQWLECCICSSYGP